MSQNCKILIVDDSEDNRDILATVLCDYQVVEAENGLSALRLAAEVHPDIILLDINMPDFNGYEVCQMLKTDPGTANIPVVFITGMNEPGQASKCFKLGAVDYIAKPFDFEEVKSRVRTHLMLREAKESLLEQNNLLEEKIREQRLSSQLAHQILGLINSHTPRQIRIDDDVSLFVNVISRSCNEEGGDHYLVKTLPGADGKTKTIVSIKDQSGHAVNCILRSIITDLLHNSILYGQRGASLGQQISRLNTDICATGFFKDDDFLTGLTLELDHESSTLQYVSAGHPAFFHIREGVIQRLPEPAGAGANLPFAFQDNVAYCAGSIELQAGDKLLLFTDGLTDIQCARQGRGSSLTADDLRGKVQELINDHPHKPIAALMRRLLGGLLKDSCDDGVSPETLLCDDVTLIGMEFEPSAPHGSRTFVPDGYDGVDEVVKDIIDYFQHIITGKGERLDMFRLRTVISEGVLNAWKHGNSQDDSKPIMISWRWINDLCISIKDTGQGFCQGGLDDPLFSENMDKVSGRGIFCIKKYADYVCWREGGAVLQVSFKVNNHFWEDEEVSRPLVPINLWMEY